MVAAQTDRTKSAAKLAAAVALADKRMRPYRNQRVKFLKEFVGPYYFAWQDYKYGSEATAEPLNTIFSMVEILCPNLIGETIFANVTTEQAGLRAFGNKLRLRCDWLSKEIDLAESIAEMVMDSLFCAGVAKVGVAPREGGGDIDEPMGYLHDPGQPFVDPVDLDDYILEKDAKRRETAIFEGNRYQVPRDWAFDCGLFDRKLLDGLEPTHIAASQQKASQMSKAEAPEVGQKYVEFLELCDLWIPHENAVVTLPGRAEDTHGYLREEAWKGPERGPYEMLGLVFPPSNAIPIPYIAVIYDLHILLNEMGRRIKNQAERQKTLGLYGLGDEKSATAVRDAKDGEMVGVRDPKSVTEFSFGGPDPRCYEAVQFFQMWQNRIAGNPDLLGGQQARSGTLGQDQMLMQQASIRINKARSRVQKFVKRILERVAWYAWTDPVTTQELTYEVKGMSIPLRWDAVVREGDFLDYNFDIEPYSLAPDTPDQQYERTLQIVRDVVIPLAPFAAQQGVFPNVQELVGLLCRKRNIKDADLWWQMGKPAVMPAARQAGGRPQPKEVTNIRTSQPPAKVAPEKGPAPETAGTVA